MKRREFITLLGGAAAWPTTVRAQQPERMRRVGVLMAIAENEEGRSRIAAFREGLRALGRVEGRNIQIEVRWTAGEVAKVQAFANELVKSKPDVILANASIVARALRAHTSDIPVVFVLVSDPVGDQLVASLAKPGGNVTGFTTFEFSLASKWLEVLKESAPSVRRIAILFNPMTAPAGGWAYVRNAEAVAASFAFQVFATPAISPDEIERGLNQFGREQNAGLIVLPDAFTSAHAGLIVACAARNGLPAVYPLRLFATVSGLISYGIDTIAQFRQAASYVDRILLGEKPSELPVQAPNKFELVINLKTAKALGLQISDKLLAIADEVIE
jgi:putative tryptophan/tyrosine transport system substrate-binding protein